MEKSYFENLPTEILYRIYDELDTETILFSIRCLCKRLYKITNSYNRYRLNFRYVSRSDLRVISRIINPENIISLTLSDSNETSDQIQLFLSYFHLNQFIRLRSLTLACNYDQDFGELEDYIMKCSLTTISVSFYGWYSTKCNKLLSSILSLTDLRQLKLLSEHELYNKLQWPIQYRLENLTLNGFNSWEQVCIILNQSLCLKTLVLEYPHFFDVDENIFTQSNMKQFDHLTYFSLLYPSSIRTRSVVEFILTMFPSLIHLRLFMWTSGSNCSLFDGNRWKNFIQTKLPQLKQLEFCFLDRTNANQDFTLMDSLISSYRTSFWIEDKHWIVKYDYECEGYNSNYIEMMRNSEDDASDYHIRRLYTIPINQNEFGYSNRPTRISSTEYYDTYAENLILHSVLNIIDNNQPFIVDSNKLILNVKSLMMENIQEKTDSIMNYKFRNVTHLTLSIYEEWPIDLIEHLSTIVNLSSLETLYLDFCDECFFATTLAIEMNSLLKRTCSLRSIRINCNDSDRIMLLTRSYIALKLPNFIKELDIQIKHFDDAKFILKQNKHLSIIKFRPYLHGEEFNEKIKKWLTKEKRDFVSKLDWGIYIGCEGCDSVKAVCIWLD